MTAIVLAIALATLDTAIANVALPTIAADLKAVMVDVSREMVHLPSDEFDVAIRSGRDSWPKLSCDLLGRLAFVPVAAPGYLRDVSRNGAWTGRAPP